MTRAEAVLLAVLMLSVRTFSSCSRPALRAASGRPPARQRHGGSPGCRPHPPHPAMAWVWRLPSNFGGRVRLAARFPSCRCRAGGRPEAARRAGLEFVETPHAKLTSTETTRRNAGMLLGHPRPAPPLSWSTWLLTGAPNSSHNSSGTNRSTIPSTTDTLPSQMRSLANWRAGVRDSDRGRISRPAARASRARDRPR